MNRKPLAAACQKRPMTVPEFYPCQIERKTFHPFKLFARQHFLIALAIVMNSQYCW